MRDQLPGSRIRIECPACYRIVVQGGLDERWSGRLGGLSITHIAVDDGTTITQLTGRLLDQAALLGVLNTLYELRLPLISVVYAADDGVDSSTIHAAG